MNALLLAVLLAVGPDDVKFPTKPGPRDFVVDEAKVVSPEDLAEIKILCDEVLTKRKAPIIVVTIPSLAAYGASGWPIETYASKLMSEWGIGWADWNYGMLLLVSITDRKVRIELGDSWPHRKNEDAKKIVSERIIPRFKQGETSRGIREGVRGLHDLALDVVTVRSQPRTGTSPAPAPSTPSQGLPSQGGGGCLPASGCGLIVLIVGGLIVVMFVARMMRRGVSSWGNTGPYGGYGGGYGGGFGSGFGGGLLGGILGSMLGNSIGRRYDSPSAPPPSYGGGDSSTPSSDNSSDFGGGSFGGGFSGGGGATGEW